MFIGCTVTISDIWIYIDLHQIIFHPVMHFGIVFMGNIYIDIDISDITLSPSPDLPESPINGSFSGSPLSNTSISSTVILQNELHSSVTDKYTITLKIDTYKSVQTTFDYNPLIDTASNIASDIITKHNLPSFLIDNNE